MPGGGKSTVGRHLARRLNWQFIDSDSVIERRIGCSIRAFFESQGEDRFRDIEEEVIAELAGTPNSVLATGGGSVLREANRDTLHCNALVVYLRSTPEDLFRRPFFMHHTLMQEADFRRDFLCKAHFMCCQQHGHALRCQISHDVENL